MLAARAAGLGVHAVDQTEAGVEVASMQTLTDDAVILPKLFRRLSVYLGERGHSRATDVGRTAAGRSRCIGGQSERRQSGQHARDCPPGRAGFEPYPKREHRCALSVGLRRRPLRCEAEATSPGLASLPAPDSRRRTASQRFPSRSAAGSFSSMTTCASAPPTPSGSTRGPGEVVARVRRRRPAVGSS